MLCLSQFPSPLQYTHAPSSISAGMPHIWQGCRKSPPPSKDLLFATRVLLWQKNCRSPSLAWGIWVVGRSWLADYIWYPTGRNREGQRMGDRLWKGEGTTQGAEWLGHRHRLEREFGRGQGELMRNRSTVEESASQSPHTPTPSDHPRFNSVSLALLCPPTVFEG